MGRTKKTPVARVLVVEDDTTWAEALSSYYARALPGSIVQRAGKYADALALLQKASAHFGLLSCDLNLMDAEGRSGYDLLEEASRRKNVHGAIVITGKNRDAALERHVRVHDHYETLMYELDPWLEGLFPGHHAVFDKKRNADETVAGLKERMPEHRLLELVGRPKLNPGPYALRLWDGEGGRQCAKITAEDWARRSVNWTLTDDGDVRLLFSLVEWSSAVDRRFKSFSDIVAICLPDDSGQRTSNEEKLARSFVGTTMKRRFEQEGFDIGRLLIPNAKLGGYELHPDVIVERPDPTTSYEGALSGDPTEDEPSAAPSAWGIESDRHQALREQHFDDKRGGRPRPRM